MKGKTKMAFKLGLIGIQRIVFSAPF